MILGMGVDICNMQRIQRILEKRKDSFLARVFTQEECVDFEGLTDGQLVGVCARRWAAKEACVKALGTGYAHGVSFHDMVLSHDRHGAPKLSLRGVASDILQRKLKVGEKANIHVSMSDDYPYAVAQVLFQAILV